MHLHSTTLHSGPLVSVTDVRCHAHADNRCGEEERSDAHVLVFVRRGVFAKHFGRSRIIADPATVLFFNADEPYHVTHPVAGGDDCTSFEFHQPDMPFLSSHTLAPPHAILTEQKLRQRIRQNASSALDVEETALALLAQTRDASGFGEITTNRAATRRRHQETVEAVKVLIAAQPERDLSLGDVARAVYSSPFHLARVFRARAGMPIHQYRLRVRLALALERLVDGANDLTKLALELGFYSHSHFSSAFVRAFGVAPSAVRTSRGPSALRPRTRRSTP